MIYFLYRHIRLDTGKPFYIGIGKKPDSFKIWNKEFRRAFSIVGRNRIWNGITSRTDYDVEILFESDDCNFIKEKEIWCF